MDKSYIIFSRKWFIWSKIFIRKDSYYSKYKEMYPFSLWFVIS